MAETTKPDDIMRELMNLHCLAEGMRALAVEAGKGELSILASFLAGRVLELHNKIDEADVAKIGGAK